MNMEGNGNAKIVDITPEMARRYLERNTHNRRLSERSVRNLATAIKNGEWQVNGEAIKVDQEGNLLDGQHRLSAIEKSGCTVRSYVVTGLARDSFKTLDTGKRRSNADALGLLGYKDAALLAASTRLVINLERAQLRSHEAVTNIQLEQFLEKNPRMIESVAYMREVKIDTVLASAMSAGLHFIFSAYDRDEADIFFADLAKGSMLRDQDPVFLLREKLMFYKSRLGARLTRQEACALVVKAWNYRRTGRLVKKLIWAKKNGEAFPAAC